MDEQELHRLIVGPLVSETSIEMARHQHIAHYTTTANLLSMLQSNELWLSNVMAMNDIAEIRGAASAIERRYFERRESFTDAERPFLDQLHFALGKLYREAWSQTYALSFSAHDLVADSEGRLSMWRAYSGDGDGVCLVLKRRNLMRDEELDFPVLSIPMRYETQDQFLLRVGKMVSHARDVFDKNREFCLSLGDPRLAEILAYALVMMAISHKHTGFSEEKELRLFHIKEHMPFDLDGIRYDAVPSGRIAKPVLRVKIQDYASIGLFDTKFSDFLEEVIVGPSVHSEIQREAVRLALDKQDLHRVPVRQSSIPYRAPR